MDLLWLGYDGLSVRYDDIVAVLLYRPSLDTRIIGAYGRVPNHVHAVVITADGRYLPARWQAEQIRRRWSGWRNGMARC